MTDPRRFTEAEVREQAERLRSRYMLMRASDMLTAFAALLQAQQVFREWLVKERSYYAKSDTNPNADEIDVARELLLADALTNFDALLRAQERQQTETCSTCNAATDFSRYSRDDHFCAFIGERVPNRFNGQPFGCRGYQPLPAPPKGDTK